MQKLKYIYFILFFLVSAKACAQKDGDVFVFVLGIAQDGGYPHMGCMKQCCMRAWEHDSLKKYVVSIALVDPADKKWWIFEATPDIKEQLHYFQMLTQGQYNYLPDGIFVTHAHIGHYTGLMDLGKEVMSTKNVPVYALPRMKSFLETNGPWSQLVSQKNIEIHPLTTDSSVTLADHITVSAFLVPHRDEYSETGGFRITTRNKKYLFIPDINKWDLWTRNIVSEVQSVDFALIDATFFDSTELPNRNMKSVPHPFVRETMSLFSSTSRETKSKIYFIHFNHTNPLLWDDKKKKDIRKAGFNLARQGEKL
jgi:pyrroloquinoline quinone biosynthesis protein B